MAATIERKDFILRALERLGHNVTYFKFRQGPVYESIWGKRLVRRKIFRWIKLAAVARINKKLLRLAAEIQPDVFIATMAANITPDTIAEFKNRGVFTVNWFTDLFSHWHIIKKLAPVYDLFGSSDTNVLKKLEEIGIKNTIYLPEAVEIDGSCDPFFNRQEKYPITFIGSYNPNVWQGREEFLNAVKDMGLNVWGPAVWQNSRIKDYRHGEVRSEAMFKIYEQSKIAVEIPWQDGVSAGIGLRPFEVMSRGACLFVYDVRPDMKKLFQEGVHYVGFQNEEELRQKTKYYLEHENERQKIARRGYEETRTSHTFAARIEQILKKMRTFNQ